MKKFLITLLFLGLFIPAQATDYAKRFPTDTALAVVTPSNIGSYESDPLVKAINGIVKSNGTTIGTVSVSSPLDYTTGTLSIPAAATAQNGYLTSTNWNTFNGKADYSFGANNFSGTGTIGAGAITGTSLIKSGGISSQFLKADGSVDTSTYLTDIVNDTTPQLGGDLDGQSLYDLNNIVDAEFEGTIGVGTTPGTTAIISAIKSMNGPVAFGVSGSITGTRSNGDMTNLRGLSYIATYTPDNLVSTARKVTNLDGAFATATIASKDGETVNISAASVQGYRSALSAIVGSGASGTVNVVSGSHYRAQDATVGNGGTFTTLRAFYDLGQTVATTNWGFYGLSAQNLMSGKLRLGSTTAPDALLALAAGTATAGTAPLKFTPSGAVLLTTAETGAMEVDTTSLYYTATGTLREKIHFGSKGSQTLTAGTTTTVTDAIAKTTSIILIQPTSAAATVLGIYVSTKNNGTFVLTHTLAAGTETIDYVIIN